METIMVELYRQQAAQWRLELRLEEEALSLRAGDEAKTVLAGLGKRESVTVELVRRAAAKAVKTVCSLGGESAVLDAAPAVELLGEAGLSALVQGAELCRYQQESWKAVPEKPFTLYLAGTEGLDGEAALARARALVRGICFTRDLVNCPPNRMTPEHLAQRAVEAGEKAGLEVQVLDEKETRELGMAAFHAVGDSSANPPRLIVLRYRGGRQGEAPLALVGKGVTFDSGGYCIKTTAGMRDMKTDMAGAASVCGAILVLAENKVPVNVVAVIPAVENRISPDSFLPGDVIGSMAGKSIEIGSTDAEGRLILADAVTYAIEKEHAGRVVDIATLTGAIARMLGGVAAGVMANDDAFFAKLQAAAERAGERFWRMPDYPEYNKLIESPVADLRNTSNGVAGAITAGLFIAAFAGDTPWLHLDIAGTAWSNSSEKEYQPAGATGMGVATLYELCRAMADE